MKIKILTLVIAALAAVTALEASAQQQNDKKPEKPNINTRQQTPVKVIEYLPGTWVIETVYRGNKNVTSTDTLAGAETIEFNREGRYVSYARNEKIDSGAYRVNEQHSFLYLASEGDNEKSTNWQVSFDRDGKMTMKIRDTGTATENITYVYRKEETATSSNRNKKK